MCNREDLVHEKGCRLRWKESDAYKGTHGGICPLRQTRATPKPDTEECHFFTRCRLKDSWDHVYRTIQVHYHDVK